jgi:peroxiredoxin
MKKMLFILMILGLFLGSCTKKNEYRITGSIQGADSGMIFMQTMQGGDWTKIDSFRIVKGEFAFTGKVDLPEMRYLTMKEKQIRLPLFVENSRITVKIYPDSVEKSEIKGSATQDIYKGYLSRQDTINREMDAIYKEYKAAKDAGDTVKLAHQDSLYTLAEGKEKALLVSFAKANPATVVSPWLILRNAYQFELPELEEVTAVFDTSLNSSYYVQTLKKRVMILQTVQVGKVAPDFTLNDTTGKPVSLSSLKGNYLLVDFWASWCGPCRAENPNVVKAYDAYKSKGFGILGVSFDEDGAKWKKAIRDDGLTWTEVSDLQGWNCSAGKAYGINSIPANVLLDKDQVIIARNLRGDDLMKKLEELLGPAGKPAKKKK